MSKSKVMKCIRKVDEENECCSEWTPDFMEAVLARDEM